MNGVFVNIKSDTSPLRAFIAMLDETLKNQNKKLDVDNLDFELIRCVKKSKVMMNLILFYNIPKR